MLDLRKVQERFQRRIERKRLSSMTPTVEADSRRGSTGTIGSVSVQWSPGIICLYSFCTLFALFLAFLHVSVPLTPFFQLSLSSVRLYFFNRIQFEYESAKNSSFLRLTFLSYAYLFIYYPLMSAYMNVKCYFTIGM